MSDNNPNETVPEEPLQDQRISPIQIEDEMQSSYIDYSMSVIVGRALPDVRDGLKPVHRRVLFAMRELGNTHNRPYKKSARVVGDVIGKYHPHGDQAVYDTIVRMAQDFSMRYRLVDGQGNFGSIDGDPPAAMRYTEVRMHRMAEHMLEDIDKNTVAFGPNYDESLEQPLVLPAALPNLLLNGSTGIAVGMATNIPPHNLGELTDALVMMIDNPECTVDDLMTHVKGPDFPTAGIICGKVPIEQMYKTGRGQMRVRGRAEIEENDKGRCRIIVTEIPYAVNKASLLETIAHLVQNKVIEGISDLRDESNKQGIRIIIELKRGVIPQVILNNLYKHTTLQTTFGAILLAINNGRPEIMNLKEILRCFLAHRFEVVTRRSEFELAKAEARAHILEGLLIAQDNLDEVVRIIRESSNRDEARPSLMSRFGLTEIQANAILEMRLYQLTGLERQKLLDEHQQIMATIEYLRDLLAHEEKIYAVIRDELLKLRNDYSDKRRTEITALEGEVNIEDLVADEPCIITLSHSGYIKRVPVDTYRAQRRGGKGVAGMATKDDDYVEMLFSAETHDTMLFFTSDGRIFWEKVYQIPEAPRTSRGKAIVNLLNIGNDEKIAALIRVREFSEEQHLMMATRRGVIKKTNLSAFKNVRRDSIIAINIDHGDELISVKPTNGEQDVMLCSRKGLSIRFSEEQLRDQGRATRGVRGMSLQVDDEIVSMEIVNPETTFLVCTENGYGKRTEFDEYRKQSRGGKGIIAIRVSERNGEVVEAHAVKEDDTLMLVTAKGKMIRMAVSDINVIGRSTQGVRLINVDQGDKLVSATSLPPDDEELDAVAPDMPTDESADNHPEETGATTEPSGDSCEQV